MVKSCVLGFPRIGANRELKKITEAYWSQKESVEKLFEVGKTIRKENWKKQQLAGVDIIPSNDFSFYDHILDHSILFNVIPDRYSKYNLDAIDTMFAMGRGLQRSNVDVPALEMVKWFDSNYHYVRPTFSFSTKFKLTSQKPVDEYLEAKVLGIETRPVLIGPVSFLHLGKADSDSIDLQPISFLEKLLPVYVELLNKLVDSGAKTIQIDEPVLVLDLSEDVHSAFKTAYDYISENSKIEVIITTYFGDVRPNISAISDLSVFGFHFDLVRFPEQLEDVIKLCGDKKTLSIGIVNGRNVWKTDFVKAIEVVEKAKSALGQDRIIVSTSSSLLHIPVNLDGETKIDPSIKEWFSFATQKLEEVVTISKAVSGENINEALESNIASIKSRKESPITFNKEVRKRQAQIDESWKSRKSSFPERLKAQKKLLNLPILPSTTIGSFPQTKDIRINRNKFNKGEISAAEYEAFIEKEIQDIIKFQDEVGLDVYVHGEPERNDMVQYFGERLNGFIFTQNGWVQSYGTRYVRPPIIVGDISRARPITVKESAYAQSLTNKPMKGMLTGPITCLRWSFPRDDLSDKDQSEQLALALRDEVLDLEKAGIFVIQVDEPAIREGFPLRSGPALQYYLKWASDSFRIATAAVKDSTQIHSHFCYSDFSPETIISLDADVVSIEFSKKNEPKYLKAFSNYPNHIGLGLFDIHSPRVPPQEEFEERISEILKFIPKDKLWINPDCGLKTRKWEETRKQLTNLVNAVEKFRD